jgi:pimeloyl-ACP methyl ester carboxylesterase
VTDRPLPQLIFIHGGGVGPWMWRQQREHFAERFTVHTPTLPGHDPSTSDEYTSHADAARSIAEQIDLDALGEDVTVVGFSVGGQVAIEFASLYASQVTRTAVVSSILKPWRSASFIAWVSAASAPLAKNRSFARAQAKQLYVPEEDFDAYFALSASTSKRTLDNVMRANFTFNPPESFLIDERPVLLVAGSQEQSALIRDLTELGDRLPDARFELIDGVGHGAPLARPAEFNAVLDSWLATKNH